MPPKGLSAKITPLPGGLDAAGDGAYVAAVIGDGPGLAELVDLLARLSAMPQATVSLAGAAEVPPSLSLPPGAGRFDSLAALLAATPGINVILTPLTSDAVLRRIRRAAPAGCLVLGGQAARFLLALEYGLPDGGHCPADLHQARNLLQSVIDRVSEDILVLDREGRIVDVNRNVYERRGKHKEDFVGFLVWEALDEEENLCRTPDADCPLSKTLRTGKAAEAMYSRVDEEGRLRYFRVYTYPIFDAAGNLTHVTEMRRDISQRTSMEHRLQQSERLAAIGELSTYIAHEIRNPLFAISGFANTLLRNKSLDEPAREKVGIILKESARLDAILKSILNFTRPTTARAGEVDVNQVVRETLDVMRLGFENAGISLRQELARDLALAKGDTDLLKQCLINLVRNAVEAMQGGGALVVRTGMDWDYVYLQVEDSGAGIAQENLERVFNPFFSTKDKGAGLGLAMIKKIFDDLGGEVRLESRLGKGTRVTLYLPPLPAGNAEPAAPDQPGA